MLRFICRETDSGTAVHVGGPVVIEHKTFTDPAALEAWLRVKCAHVWRECIGVEVVEETRPEQVESR